jgi:hypothetical protein
MDREIDIMKRKWERVQDEEGGEVSRKRATKELPAVEDIYNHGSPIY